MKYRLQLQRRRMGRSPDWQNYGHDLDFWDAAEASIGNPQEFRKFTGGKVVAGRAANGPPPWQWRLASYEVPRVLSSG